MGPVGLNANALEALARETARGIAYAALIVTEFQIHRSSA